MVEADMLVKENVVARRPLSAWWVWGALGASAALLGGVALRDAALPEPLSRAAPPDRFSADIAYDHLLNLTALGPRVAGSYENEVLAVGAVAAAVRQIARAAAPHNRVELDVFRSSGAFSLDFLDGMNNVYRDVSSVVARVSAAGGRARPAHRRAALLLNCHIDTVPDSPGASDDGAGCAVLLETLRALAASRHPLRHDAIFLFNGAEENIMQASHGFVTHHKWAASVRAFINVEACGAGGRELLFQAGPHDPWLVEAYAGAAPHPFASSVAQELFESGLIPADTDFRIFRDFGRVSGLDLAWSANGHVYHTRLDTAERVPRGALQRTGDNVLAVARALLASERLARAGGAGAGAGERQPVYFDVLGLWVVTARAPAAAAAALAALAAALLQLHVTARRAQRDLLVPYWWWARTVGGACVALGGAAAAGVAAAVAVALALAAAGVRLAFYSRAWLLAPLYAMPVVVVVRAAVAGAWWAAERLVRAGPLCRGWWRARAAQGAAAALAAAAGAAAAAAGARAGALPALWAAPAAAADAAWRGGAGARAALWAAAAAPAAALAADMALAALRTLVPLAGRAGAAAVPADAAAAALVAALALLATAWMLPLVVVARRMPLLIRALWACCLCACVWAWARGCPYSAECPQRVMVLHTRRTVHPHAPAPAHAAHHAPAPAPAAHHAPAPEHFYWIPDLDDNSPHSLDMYAEEFRLARPMSDAACARWVWCGAPYFLPARGRVARAHEAPAPTPPRARLHASVAAARLNGTLHELSVHITRGPAHAVVIVSPAAGARVVWSSAVARPLAAPRWGHREVYFFALHQARAFRPYRLVLHLQHEFPSPPAQWAALSVAGHAMFGEDKLAPEHARLAAALPAWAAHTGWGVDLHLYTV